MVILQWIYITVGLLTLSALSTFVMTQCFIACWDVIEKIKRPYWKYQAIKKYADLENAFYQDKKVQYIFKCLKDKETNDMGINAWDFRDLLEKEFNAKESTGKEG